MPWCFDQKAALAIRQTKSIEYMHSFTRWPNTPFSEPNQDFIFVIENLKMTFHQCHTLTSISGDFECLSRTTELWASEIIKGS